MVADHDLVAIKASIENALLRSSAGVTTLAEFDAARDALMRTVHAAITNVAESWNFATRRFPAEILLRCFSELGPRDRIVSACVSRAWRATALSDTTLWQTITVKAKKDMTMERRLMSRAGLRPLDFTLVARSYDYDESISQLFMEHLHHMRTINISGRDLTKLVGEAPLLESITSEGTVTLPRSPRLKHVNVMCLTVTDLDFKCSELFSFSGHLSGDHAPEFFTVCPNLERLELTLMTPSLRPTGPTHTNLRHLKLVGTDAQSDYLATFHACRSLQSIELHGFRIASAISLFSAIGRIPTALELHYKRAVLKTDIETETMVCARLEQSLQGVIALPALRHLIISSTYDLSGLTLSVLERLTFQVTSTGLRDLSRDPYALFSATALQTLVLHMKPEEYHSNRDTKFLRIVVKYLPALLRRLGLTRISALVLTGEEFDSSQFDDAHISSLRDCVDDLYHDEQRIEIPSQS